MKLNPFLEKNIQNELNQQTSTLQWSAALHWYTAIPASYSVKGQTFINHWLHFAGLCVWHLKVIQFSSLFQKSSLHHWHAVTAWKFPKDFIKEKLEKLEIGRTTFWLSIHWKVESIQDQMKEHPAFDMHETCRH